MKVTVLGCGSSAGTPVINCVCPVCLSKNKKNKRTRCSTLINANKKNIIIDTSPDLKQQVIREEVRVVDAVLFTHHHADHCHGIDDLRAFCQRKKSAIPIFANEFTMHELENKFGYAIREASGFWETPVLQKNILKGYEPIKIDDLTVTPIPVMHGKLEILGYRINNFAYITDVSEIPEAAFNALTNLDTLFLDCLRFEPHYSHIGFNQSLEIAKKIKAKRTFFIHMTHDIEYKEVSSGLPKNIFLAYDGLKLEIN
jgi:phosphoribosyl 1,2-cyclic phosphate phosphodiesterase